MKTFFKIFGLVLLLAAVTGIVIFFLSDNIEKETSPFVRESVGAISESWDTAELETRAEPGLIKAMESQGQSVDELFAMYKKLGKLKEPARCALKNTTDLIKGSEVYTSASYTCDADYEGGPASIAMTVRKGSSQTAWKIYYINIQSPAFAAEPER